MRANFGHMDNSAEVYHRLGEFINDRGLWYEFCEDAHEHGITPHAISAALNQASLAAGHPANLTPEACQDCQE